MRRRDIALAAAMLLAAAGAKAQDCETIMLPFFHWDAAQMADYPAEKLDWRCRYARAAFYEADTVPAGAVVQGISEVVDRQTGKNLPEDYVVDMATLSFYACNFQDFQRRHPKGNVTVCFSTPGSGHPYLVMRSVEEMHRRAAHPEKYSD